MSAATQTIASLPPLQRRMAQVWLMRFQQAWHVEKLKECMQALPPQSSLRTPLLLAMMECDLELSWKDGRAVAVSDYLKDFPELGGIDQIPTALFIAEFNARHRHGRADLADFAERYPTRIDDIHLVLQPRTNGGSAGQSASDPSQSKLMRRLQLVRAPAVPTASDPAAERRLKLLRGEAPAINDSRMPADQDDFDLFLPIEARKVEANQNPGASHSQRAWLDVEDFRDPATPATAIPQSPSGPSEPAQRQGTTAAKPASHTPVTGPGPRPPTSTPLPSEVPAQLASPPANGSAAYQKMQEIRQLSGSYDPEASLPWNSPFRPRGKRQPWRRVVLGAIGAAVLTATLFLLSGLHKREVANSDVPHPAPAANDEELAIERARLLSGLKDASLDVRRTSAEKLREFKGDDVVAALVDRVGDNYWPDSKAANGSDRTEALLTLRLLDKAALPAALTKAMRSENDRVRIWATMEVIHAADPKLEPVLIAALNDANGHVRALAADGLRLLRWDTRPVIVALSKRVTEPWALRSLGGASEDLSDPRGSGRDAAVEALIALSPDDAEAVLDKAAVGASPQLRQWASQVRTRFFGKKPAGP